MINSTNQDKDWIQSFIFYSSENDKLHEPGQGLNTTSSVNLNTRINSVEQGNSGKKIKIMIEIFKPTKFQKKLLLIC